MVAEKADSTYPITSAASICAKVTRDHMIRDFSIPGIVDIDRNWGSGYPADPVTKKWL